MQVARPAEQHAVMIEAVENHMPEVIVIDEIGTELEAQAARTIAERGVQLVGTAHGRTLDNLLVNPTLCDLVGGVQAVTLGDEEAKRRGTQKTVLERKSPPTFDVLVEQQSWREVIVHIDVAAAVDAQLRGRLVYAERRTLDEQGQVHIAPVVVESPDAAQASATDTEMYALQSGESRRGRRDRSANGWAAPRNVGNLDLIASVRRSAYTRRPRSCASTAAATSMWTMTSRQLSCSTRTSKVGGLLRSSTVFCVPLRLASSSPNVTACTSPTRSTKRRVDQQVLQRPPMRRPDQLHPRSAIVLAACASSSVPISSMTMTSGMWFSTASIITRCCSAGRATCMRPARPMPGCGTSPSPAIYCGVHHHHPLAQLIRRHPRRFPQQGASSPPQAGPGSRASVRLRRHPG